MRRAVALILGLALAALLPAMAAQAQPGSPDLAVTDVRWDQLSVGEDTAFTAEIENVGDGERQSNFTVRLHLEEASFEDEVTVELDEPMGPGDTRNVTASPWQAERGTYTINATVEEDDGGLFGDDGYDDNDYDNRTFALGPDILTHEVRLDPSSPIAGEEVTFTAEIENVAGDENDVTDPFIVAFDVVDEDGDTTTIESKPVDELRAKDPKQISARTTWPSEAGSYTLVARADADGNITEADEDNNEAERAFSVQAAEPDLVVTDVEPTNPRVQDGEQTPIAATIENQGTANVSSDFPVRFRINGTTHGPDVGVDVGDGLRPGDEVTVTSTAWRASEGHHELVAIADPGNRNVTGEPDLSNNEHRTDVHVGPDLVVADILWTPDPPAAGNEVTIEPVVRNQGTADVTTNTTLEVAVEPPNQDPQSWNVTVGPLGAGNATQADAVRWTPSEQGTDQYPYDVPVTAETDVDDEADEVDELNNDRQKTMSVTEPRPDLVTDAVELDPSAPATGEQTTIQATIANNGSAAAEEVEVAFLVDGEQLGETKTIAGSQVATLDAGDQATVESDAWDPTLGTHTITVNPELAAGGPEVREDNNNGTREALVGPDALVEDIDRDPTNPEAEDEVTFDVTVANAGTEPIDALDLRVEVDGETVGEPTVNGLDAGDNATASVTWNATEGDHTVRAILDPDETVAEAREGNNQREESFSTTASPDLQPTSLRWTEDPRAGDKVVFTATVANTGTAAVEGTFTVDFTVDGEEIGSATIEGLETGASKSASSQAWTAEAGTHTVKATVDASDAVTEGDEANNARTASATVADREDEEPASGPANLTVTEISKPEDVEAGDEVTFLATIENDGGQRAPASQVRFLVDGEVFGEPEIDALAPGQRQSVTSEAWNATEGEHKITAIADVRDAVDEANEDDNDRITRLQVGSPADDGEDEAGGISLGPVTVEDPRAGDPVRPTVTVTNDGDEARNVTVTFYVDGTSIGEATLTDLAANGQESLEGPEWTPTVGEHTVTARSGDAQAETLVDVASAEEPSDAPGLGLAAVIVTLAALARLARR